LLYVCSVPAPQRSEAQTRACPGENVQEMSVAAPKSALESWKIQERAFATAAQPTF
jgi:hypothetical protein